MLKPAGPAPAGSVPATEGPVLPRAFLRIGPASLARHQLSLALMMDCQRFVCIAPEMSPDLMQLQADSERAGARFHLVGGAHGLAALVTAADEVVVIADGLLVPIEQAANLLEGPHSVLVQPVESGLAAGFERIDLNHASAGLMRIPGRLVDRLHELPADCEVESALTRIALQAGVPQRPLPPEAMYGLRWQLVSNEAEAHAAEAGWIAVQLENHGPATPAAGLARLAVRRFGPAILHAGRGGNALAMGAAASLALSIGLAWPGYMIAAMVFWAWAWIVRRAATLLLAVERESFAQGSGKWSRETMFGFVHDAALMAILTRNGIPWPGADVWDCLFGPLILAGLLRLAPRLLPETLSAWMTDRLLLGLLLAFLAGSGLLVPGIQAIAAAILLLALVWPTVSFRLTSV